MYPQNECVARSELATKALLKMARRRRRIATEFKIKHSSLFAFILLNLLITSATSHQHHHEHQHHLYRATEFAGQAELQSSLSSQHQNQNLHQRQRQPVPATAAHLCALLPRQVSKHLKLCRLIAHSADADEAVTLGASRGLAECRNQFKSDRWNCTHSHGDHHLLTSELAQSIGNRESGFLHAVLAAGIVHSIATACSVGNLSDCACDKTRVGSIGKEENWKWGGCSNNIRHGMLFAKHLVELLDTVHSHSRYNKPAALTSRHFGQHHVGKRSLSSRYREPNQLRGQQLTGALTPVDQFEQEAAGKLTVPPSYCQQNHNLSRATHSELIKSLLSKNSLERHQEFRLAMNMHNNKVGRMVSSLAQDLLICAPNFFSALAFKIQLLQVVVCVWLVCEPEFIGLDCGVLKQKIGLVQ